MAIVCMIVNVVKILSHVDAHVMSLGKHSLVFSRTWEKLASHELGQVALTLIVMSQQGFV
jgi:hypothetical protein